MLSEAYFDSRPLNTESSELKSKRGQKTSSPSSLHSSGSWYTFWKRRAAKCQQTKSTSQVAKKRAPQKILLQDAIVGARWCEPPARRARDWLGVLGHDGTSASWARIRARGPPIQCPGRETRTFQGSIFWQSTRGLGESQKKPPKLGRPATSVSKVFLFYTRLVWIHKKGAYQSIESQILELVTKKLRQSKKSNIAKIKTAMHFQTFGTFFFSFFEAAQKWVIFRPTKKKFWKKFFERGLGFSDFDFWFRVLKIRLGSVGRGPHFWLILFYRSVQKMCTLMH